MTKKSKPKTDSGKKNVGGRPAHKPTAETRKQVETMTGFGVPQPAIAGLLGIHPETMRIHYRAELDQGVAKANLAMAQSLYQKGLGNGPQSGACAMFWMKTRAGWKETNVYEHTGKDGGPIETRESPRERLASRIARLAPKREEKPAISRLN